MKVVPALNTPDVRHEITLLGGVWEPPAQGKGGINRKAPRKGGVSKGVRGVLHQEVKGNSSMEPPEGTLHPRILNRLNCLMRGSQQVSGGGCRRT